MAAAANLAVLRKDVDKLRVHQRTSAAKSETALDEVVAQLCAARDLLRSASGPVPLAAAHKKVKQCVNDIVSEQKETHNALSKCTKQAEKTFKTDVGAASNPQAFDDKRELLNASIAHHLYREGRFNLGETFSQEASVGVDQAIKLRFSEMYDILENMKQRNLGPALDRAAANRDRLDAKGSALEFKLSRQQYLHLLASGNRLVTVAYAKAQFPRLSPVHFKDVQRLMGMLLFADRLPSSPYADLVSPAHWIDIEHAFARDYCALLGLPNESPLFVCVTTGTTALPTLLKMSRVMQTQKTEWSQQDELPVEIPLGPGLMYHSVFVCPVAKEQVTRTNPPMMIPCGHVICQESLTKLTKGNGRLKCPYCPTETTKSQAKRVHF